MAQKLVYEFVTLFVVLDPFGMLAIFLAVTAGLESAQRVKAAVLAWVCRMVITRAGLILKAPAKGALSGYNVAHVSSVGTRVG
ncbi:MAG: hypothetical protein C1943_17300 [Halochromatium sp.]|nr:hypothetical protein [Halochromatium sp.]